MSAESKVKDIKRVYLKRSNLIAQLSMALSIHKVWPDAFAENQRCGIFLTTLSINGKEQLTGVYLERSDGCRHYCTAQEALTLGYSIQPVMSKG